MNLSCDLGDEPSYVEISEYLRMSAAPCRCLECRLEIPAFTPFYMVRNWRPVIADDDYDAGMDLPEEEIELSHLPCCEECGHLAASVLESGYCWTYGNLRADIRDASGLY